MAEKDKTERSSSRRRSTEYSLPNTVERTMPHDTDAEVAVLSAMMIDNYAVAKGIESLNETHFYKNAHRVIFKAMSQLFEQNIEVDLITLIHRLEEAGEIEYAGGKPYINEISDVVLSSANLEYHAKIVLDKALLRSLITTANEIIKMAYDSDMPTADIIDNAEQKIFEIAEIPQRRSLVRVGEVIADAHNKIIEIANTGTSVTGLPSGLSSLDARIGGFKPGQFIVVAARPAMGKSSFALNIATYLASRLNKKIAVFTLEMSTHELGMRLLSSESEIPMNNLQNGLYISSESIREIARVVQGYADVKLYIDDTGSNTVMDIRAKTRRLKAELKGLDMIVIDYIQLMTSNKKTENRQQEISEISRGLKVLAKELDVPVMALSQLNRLLEARKDKRPLLSDLRESGAIEQDADVVMFIYRDEFYKATEENKNLAEIIIGKNRHGASGVTVKLKFNPAITSFRDLDVPPEDN